MFNKLYKKSQFLINPLSLFLNPFYLSRRGLYNKLKPLLKDIRGCLLDFGCGDKPYQSLFSSIDDYIGLDIEDRGHDHTTEDINILYDGKIIPFDDNHFDVVFATEVFEHVDNLDEIIIEIKRVLKPNGKLIMTVPFVFMEHEIPFDFRRFSQYGVKQFLTNNKFEIQHLCVTTKDIESIFQVISVYIYSLYATLQKHLRLLLTILLISPLNILGLTLAFIFPNKHRLYMNVIAIGINKK